jgi:putative DNA modification/repair radical SAM protein
MDLIEKLGLLSMAARYDVSCASSGSRRGGGGGGTGATAVGGICHSWSDDGRCISLLKILFSSHCIYDCAYCANRASNPAPRATFTPEEVVELTMNFYRRNYIEGLFLSSGVVRSPDHTMERLVRTVELLRAQPFHGYVHVKAIPGASLDLIRRAGRSADRVSLNIELPTEASLRRLAPEKRKDDILVPMERLGRDIADSRAERRRDRRAPSFAPAGQSTQLIVGASPESDRQILRLSQGLYRRFGLRRVYYSAYMAVNDDRRLPCGIEPPLLREHRLYQADWLVRRYGFDAEDVLPDGQEFLDADVDPKSAWALRHLDRFPVDLDRAGIEALRRVPGIGHVSASRIAATRRFGALREEDLPRLGVVLKRARHFVVCGGRHLGGGRIDAAAIRRQLAAGRGRTRDQARRAVQGELAL